MAHCRLGIGVIAAVVALAVGGCAPNDAAPEVDPADAAATPGDTGTTPGNTGTGGTGGDTNGGVGGAGARSGEDGGDTDDGSVDTGGRSTGGMTDGGGRDTSGGNGNTANTDGGGGKNGTRDRSGGDTGGSDAADTGGVASGATGDANENGAGGDAGDTTQGSAGTDGVTGDGGSSDADGPDPDEPVDQPTLSLPGLPIGGNTYPSIDGNHPDNQCANVNWIVDSAAADLAPGLVVAVIGFEFDPEVFTVASDGCDDDAPPCPGFVFAADARVCNLAVAPIPGSDTGLGSYRFSLVGDVDCRQIGTEQCQEFRDAVAAEPGLSLGLEPPVITDDGSDGSDNDGAGDEPDAGAGGGADTGSRSGSGTDSDG